MKQATTKNFPGGSKSRVNLAGDKIRTGKEGLDDLLVIDEWRAAHRAVLNTFQAILRTRTRGKGIFVAQRHKRKSTIFGKLDRFPGKKKGSKEKKRGQKGVTKRGQIFA